jgi:hypothetical protein
MTNALTTTTGTGIAPQTGGRKALRNHNGTGLTYYEWLQAARVSTSPKYYTMWADGTDPLSVKSKTLAAKSKDGASDNPIAGWSPTAKIALGVGIGVVAIGAITGTVYLLKKKAAAKGGGTLVAGWKRVSTGNIPPNATARLAIPGSVMQQFVPVVVDGKTLQTALSTAGNQLAGVSAWGPGDTALPADWPTDDVGVKTEFHAEFTNNTGMTINPANGVLGVIPPLPVMVWVKA